MAVRVDEAPYLVYILLDLDAGASVRIFTRFDDPDVFAVLVVLAFDILIFEILDKPLIFEVGAELLHVFLCFIYASLISIFSFQLHICSPEQAVHTHAVFSIGCTDCTVIVQKPSCVKENAENMFSNTWARRHRTM